MRGAENDKRAVRPRSRRAPLPGVTRFILLVNALGLTVLLAGAVFLNDLRDELIDARQDALREQGRFIARILAEPLAPDARGVDADVAQSVLRALADTTEARILFFDPDGVLAADTRLMREDVVARALPPPASRDFFGRVQARAREAFEGFRPTIYLPGDPRARARGHSLSEDVTAALRGEAREGLRIDETGELTVSATVPVRKVAVVVGVLTLETAGVEAIIASERRALFAFFAVALLATAVSTVFVTFRVARPLRGLARAADRFRVGAGKAEIPDLSERGDEIGDLSVSLRTMTEALNARMTEIERFAADVAHELKNPLTSLKSAVEILARADTPERRAKLIDVALHDVRRIDRLITDISSASRLDAEMSRQLDEPIDLAILLDDLVRHEYSERSQGPRVRYAGPPAGLIVRGSPDGLARVFRNLVDNALSFSPEEEEVTVLIGFAGLGAEAIEASVEDRGPGVPEEAKTRIFERFYTDRPAEQGFGGNSGLGLSICKRIVEAHGGTLRVENRHEGGARFTARLPAEPSPIGADRRFRSEDRRD